MALQGLEELNSKFKLLDRLLRQKVLLKETKEAAEIIRADAESRAPIGETGDLAEHQAIQAKPSLSNSSDAVVWIGFDLSVFYGGFVELGTTHSAPEPFLLPAFESKKGQALDKIADGIASAIDDFVRTHGST